MAMKEYSAFPKAPASLESHHQIVQCHNQGTHWSGGGGSYPSTEVQSVYSTAPANRAKKINEYFTVSMKDLYNFSLNKIWHKVILSGHHKKCLVPTV